jgi:transglutaminase-like putative cysteine protease
MFARAGSASIDNAAWTSPPITRVKLTWALTALVLTALPFVNDVPAWILLVIAVTVVWRYVAFVGGYRLPHAVLRMGWAVANFVMVYVSYGTVNGLEAGTALLLVMTAMKLTETATTRDLVVVVYMGFFMVVAHALYDQNIGATLYGALALFFVVAALLQVTRRSEPARPRRALSRSAVLLAQALPLTLLMFVLFPRVPGPFWALPTTSSGVTGLSDTMNPGAISNLLESSAVAFRVEFQDTVPPPAVRYWRGPVLDRIDEGTWSASAAARQSTNVTLIGERYDYALTLEPHQRLWMFALDLPTLDALPASTTFTSSLELLARKPVKERRRIRLSSHADYRASPDTLGNDRALYLDTSQTRNPRTRDMARRLRAEHSTDEDLINAMLTHFRREPFSYTLRPPRLRSSSPSDEFLFQTRRGFCEHYASSFTLLMRYADIPARVVTGYQGGERNPLTGHFTVRQSDAHAWSEVWLAQRGWVRVDPTGAVAPERVERGITGALGADESLSPLILGNGPLLSRLRFGWDAANAAWNRHILAYGQSAQRDLLRRLGLDATSLSTLVALLTATGIAALGALAAWLAISGRQRQSDPLLRAWALLSRRLAHIGLERAGHEGPLDYAARVAAQRPDIADRITAITRDYVALRYGGSPSPGGRRRLIAQVRAFRPRRAKTGA